MKAFKLSLESYEYKEVEQKEPATVNVKISLCQILCHAELRLAGRELLKSGSLCERIEASSDSILLSEEDHKRMVSACENVPGISRAFIKLLERVFDAEEVEVEEIS